MQVVPASLLCLVSWFLAEKPGLLGLLTCTSVEADAVAGGVCEEGEPTHVRDFCLGNDSLAAKRFSFGKGGIDVVGRDINEYFASLVRRVFTYLDEATSRTILCLEHVVIESLVELNVPTEEIRVELA